MKKLTNFFNCAAKSLQKTGGGDSQKNVHHLGVASEMPPRCFRLDLLLSVRFFYARVEVCCLLVACFCFGYRTDVGSWDGIVKSELFQSVIITFCFYLFVRYSTDTRGSDGYDR